MNKLGAYACFVLGAYVIYHAMFVGFGVSILGVIFGLVLVAAGIYILSNAASAKPPYPEGFNADYWNKNIALNTATGSLWVRDAGRSAVLQRHDVLGWEMQNSNFGSAAIAGPRVTPMDNKLILKTSNLDRPIWTVKFDAHSSLTGTGNHQNHNELKVWYERLNAFYNHRSA